MEHALKLPPLHHTQAGLARTLGPEAPTLLQLIQSPPSGSEELALQVRMHSSGPVTQMGR